MSAALPPTTIQTMAVSAGVDDLIWDASRSRFLASTGTSVLVVDPEAPAIERMIAVGDRAGRIAVSGDGQFLFVAVDARAVVKRYRLGSGDLDGENAVPTLGSVAVVAMASVPGDPRAVVVSSGREIIVVDPNGIRPGRLASTVSSLYSSPDGHIIFGWGAGQLYRFEVDASGVKAVRPAVAVFAANEPIVGWSGRFVWDFSGDVFDLDAGAPIGRAGYPASALYHSPSVVFAASNTMLTAQQENATGYTMVLYSLDNLRPMARSALDDAARSFIGVGSWPKALPWGSDGMAVVYGAGLAFAHAAGMQPVGASAPPQPSVDASGVIRLPLPLNGMTFDQSRGLIWGAVPGSVEGYGNSVVSINPANGQVVDAIDAGSEPTAVTLSGDASRLFTTLRGSLGLATLDLNAKQRERSVFSNDPNYTAPTSPVGLSGSGSVAVVWKGPSYTSRVVIYDDGTPRPQSYTGGLGNTTAPYVSALFPGESADALYGADLELQNGAGQHELMRMRIEEKGISLDQSLGAMSLGSTQFGGAVIYDSGHIFTSGGEIRTPDAQTLEMTFALQQSYAAVGIPIPFTDRNQVAFVYLSALTNQTALTLFDIPTGRPIATMPLASTFSGVNTAVRAGPSTIAVSMSGQLLLIPLASLQPWPQYTPGLQRVSAGVQSARAPKANSMAALPGTNKLLLALPSTAGNLGNSIAVLNGDTGLIEKSTFIGSEPTLLRVKPDGSAAYAYLSGEGRVARYNVAASARDLVYIPDPTGKSTQYSLVDMAVGPDGGLTISYQGGWLATWDGDVMRPSVDKNTQGVGAFSGAPYAIALNPSGTVVYGYDYYWSFADFKREAVGPDGIHFLSGGAGLLGSGFIQAGGLLYTSSGNVVDPERWRTVGRLGMSGPVAPDPDAGRVYAISGNQLAVFDSGTYAKVAAATIGTFNTAALDLVRFGSGGLAFRSSDDQIYLVQISSIPPLAAPVVVPQPTLPATPGVTVVDLAAVDLAYDSSRDLLYVSVPNKEAANGDQVAAIDPGSGKVTAKWPAGSDPRSLALSADNAHLFVSSGTKSLGFYSGFSTTSEAVHDLDPAAGALGPGFPAYPATDLMSWGVTELEPLAGQPASVAMLDYWTQFVSAGAQSGVGSGSNTLRIFDGGQEREKYLRAHTFSCTTMASGATPSKLYCSDGATITRLALDPHGVTMQDSIRLLPGRGAFGKMAFRNGRIYTTTGNVVDVDAGRVVARVNAQGVVAVDDRFAYWLDPGATQNSVTLRVFDSATLQLVSTKQINVSTNDLTRMVTCGNGRLAFRAGNEVYIVQL